MSADAGRRGRLGSRQAILQLEHDPFRRLLADAGNGGETGDVSTFHIYFGSAGNGSIEGLSAAELKGIPKKTVSALQQALRMRGVDLMSYTGGLTSLAHTDEDVRQTVQAFEGAVTELLGQGLLERR